MEICKHPVFKDSRAVPFPTEPDKRLQILTDQHAWERQDFKTADVALFHVWTPALMSSQTLALMAAASRPRLRVFLLHFTQPPSERRTSVLTDHSSTCTKAAAMQPLWAFWRSQQHHGFGCWWNLYCFIKNRFYLHQKPLKWQVNLLLSGQKDVSGMRAKRRPVWTLKLESRVTTVEFWVTIRF